MDKGVLNDLEKISNELLCMFLFTVTDLIIYIFIIYVTLKLFQLTE